jgi:hypothetical protein
MRNRNFPTALVAATLLLATCAAQAAPKVVASLVQPPGGLSCTDAAERTQVVFDFQRPRKDLQKVSVFVNGEGVPEKDVAQDWPRLRVLHGLHPGRNTVEVFATDRKGRAIAHELVVLIGEKPDRDERDAAIVDCSGRLATREPERDGPAGEMLDWNGEIVDEAREADIEDVEYVERVYDGPVYVYHPYPFYSYYRYAPVYYYPYAYYGYYPRTHHHHHYDRGPGRAWDRQSEAPRQHWSGPQHAPRTMSNGPSRSSSGNAWRRNRD